MCVCVCLKYTKLVSMWIALSSVHGSACVKLHAHLSAYMYLCVCVRTFGQITFIINVSHYSNETISLSLKRPCPWC